MRDAEDLENTFYSKRTHSIVREHILEGLCMRDAEDLGFRV
jgi:hypothetical protein